MGTEAFALAFTVSEGSWISMERPDLLSSAEFARTIKDQVVNPLVASFFARVTPQQWSLLKAGEPDQATKVMLANPLLEVISCVSQHVFTVHIHKDSVSEEDVRADVGAEIFHIFGDFLEVEASCVSWEKLTTLIVEESTRKVNAALFNCVNSVEEECLVTVPATLGNMIELACRILQECNTKKEKEKMFCAAVQRRAEQLILSPANHLQDADSKWDDPWLTALKERFERVIDSEWSQIAAALTTSACEYNLLRSENSLEIKNFAGQLANKLLVDFKWLKRTAFRNLSDRFKLMHRQKRRNVLQVMRILFAKQFMKTSIYHMADQMRTIIHHDGEERSKESVQLFMESLDCLFVTELDKTNETNMFWKLKHICTGEVKTFTEALIRLIHRHVIQRKEPATITDMLKRIAVSHLDLVLEAAVQNKLQCCLGLMSWWVNSQAAMFTENVTSALMDPESLSAIELPERVGVTPPGDESGQDRRRKEQRRMFVMALVEQVVVRTYNQAEARTSVLIADVMKQLRDDTWAEVENFDFDTTRDATKLHVAVFKELRKRSGGVEQLLTAMKTRQDESVRCMAATLTDHLTKPQQPCCLARFFCCVGKAVANAFRWTKRVSVI